MGQEKGLAYLKIHEETNLENNLYDALLLIAPPTSPNLKVASKLGPYITKALKCDPSLDKEIGILPLPDFTATRLVYSPTGPLDSDYDDVRSLKEAAVKGVQRAVRAGFRKLLLILEDYPTFENSELVTLLGVLEALYTPIQARENNPSKAIKLDLLGVLTSNEQKTKNVVRLAKLFESGLSVARDIAGGDPERMCPTNVQKYVEEVFGKSAIQLGIVDDPNVFAKDYPLFEAVNRAASVVERHKGRIIYLEYNPPGPIRDTLMLVGKGVTYDTGGADVKVNGAMVGMSRDKCGAAAVAGFMKIVDELKPQNVKVIGAMSVVRNSVGSESYVSDEIIVSRSKVAVRVGNTDAEGRMVMADVLCRMKEIALNEFNPHLFTIATLTGHAYLTVGKGYSIAMDNGPARKAGTSKKLQHHGDILADPFEISTIRREDLSFHRGKTEGEDVFQANSAASVRTCRGHQGPAAFLLLASGLDKYGSGNEKPLKYSHLDICGAAGDYPEPPTGAPIIALASAFLLH